MDLRHDPARDWDRETPGPGVTYYAQARGIAKYRCKLARFTIDTHFSLASANMPNCYKRAPVMFSTTSTIAAKSCSPKPRPTPAP